MSIISWNPRLHLEIVSFVWPVVQNQFSKSRRNKKAEHQIQFQTKKLQLGGNGCYFCKWAEILHWKTVNRSNRQTKRQLHLVRGSAGKFTHYLCSISIPITAKLEAFNNCVSHCVRRYKLHSNTLKCSCHFYVPLQSRAWIRLLWATPQASHHWSLQGWGLSWWRR